MIKKPSGREPEGFFVYKHLIFNDWQVIFMVLNLRFPQLSVF